MRYTTFHDGQIGMDVDHWVDSGTLPAGLYVRWQDDAPGHDGNTPCWFHSIKRNGHSYVVRINSEDLPDWVRTYSLIF